MKIIRSFPTKKRKPLFCALLLFLLVALMLTSCARETDYTTETDEAGFPNETLLARIENDYGKYLEKTYGKSNKYPPVVLCYGIYNGCVPVMFSQMSLDVMTDIEVVGIIFHYGSTNEIKVWKDGNFYSVQEAYDQGLLTREQVQTLADVHNNKEYKWIEQENANQR